MVARFAVYDDCFGLARPDERVCNETFLNDGVVRGIEVLKKEGTFIVIGIRTLVGCNVFNDQHTGRCHSLEANMRVVEVGTCITNLRSDSIVEVFKGCYGPLRHLRCAIGEDICSLTQAVPVLCCVSL